MAAVENPFVAPKGTHDVLPPESGRWQWLIATFADLVGRSGYGLVQGPMFEHLEVFQRMGATSDVVRKEMYDFADKGGRHLALRPEGTAGVVRAYVQHRPTPPWKVWYAAPNFRYEQAQAGRFRQHHQLGVELIGTADADADAEVVTLLSDFFAGIGLRQVELLVNSIGDAACRPGYTAALLAHLEADRDALCDEHRERFEGNPLRILDCKRAACREVSEGAPRTVDHLCEDCATHFARFCGGLDAAGVVYRVEPRLVRGLDYYTRTTFEFVATALASAQSTIGGGGRYDGLVEQMGGPPTPGIGFGCGIERSLLACDAEGRQPEAMGRIDIFVVDVTGGAAGRDLALGLRREGFAVDRAFDGRSMKAQMKVADRSGAAVALILGEDELATGAVTLREMRGDAGQRTVPLTDVADELRRIL